MLGLNRRRAPKIPTRFGNVDLVENLGKNTVSVAVGVAECMDKVGCL